LPISIGLESPSVERRKTIGRRNNWDLNLDAIVFRNKRRTFANTLLCTGFRKKINSDREID